MTRTLALTLLTAALGCALAQAELRPDQQYAAGARVQSSAHGLTFNLPAGWLGVFKKEGGQSVLVLGSETVEGVGLAILLQNQTQAQVVGLLREEQDLGGGVVLRPTAAPSVQGSKISARYLNPQYVGRAIALLGPAKSHVIFFYAGPQKNERLYGQLLEGLAASARFAAPQAQQPQRPAQQPAAAGPAKEWNGLLAGMMLRYFSSYNGGAGGGISDEATLHLCSDGSFAFFRSSLATINVPGANASSGGQDRDGGRWRVESATAQGATLVLVSQGGSTERIRVTVEDGKTFLNGNRWFRVESDTCR
ncbi:MAG: hypothetical protein SFU83_15390 [Meiothermus sp.]|nr:hypothetical protein [Meiothermus sp.]